MTTINIMKALSNMYKKPSISNKESTVGYLKAFY
uniref:Uncharacterized protein n=2 Tax=Physcomitrium patens TaxID=3218 RepID=A0A2K1JCX6_PHYPA|nr:hypothetical protein PHYPA_019659 [Physcomitrium patens]